jgi:hypothetical protein
MVPPLDQTPNTDREATRQPSGDAAGTTDSVEWRDISTAPPAVDGESTNDVASRIHERSGDSLTIETPKLTVTLVGVPRIAVGDLVDTRHRSEDVEADATRHCALFDIENTSTVPVHWVSRHTTFVGSDGNSYGTADLPLDASQLPPGCHANHIGIESRCRARVMTPVEALPDAVTVQKVIHTIADARYAADQRLLFTL